MSAVDLPPGLGLAGTALATFRSPRGARRLAHAVLAITLVCGALTWWGVSRQPYQRHASTWIVLSVALVLVAVLGVAVRRATVWVGREGVRWGWRLVSVRQAAERVLEVRVYRDGATLRSPRGSWFLAARDWERFEALARALVHAGLPVTRFSETAPWRQRLQSYGRTLDGLLILAALAQAALVALAS